MTQFPDWYLEPPEEREALDEWAYVPDEPYEQWRDKKALADIDERI